MKYLLYIMASLMICSCSNREKVNRQLMSMYGTSVEIELDSMRCWKPIDEDYFDTTKNSKLTLVIFSDTTDCSICYLQQLRLWNDLIKMEKESNGIIRFLFIIEARDGESNILYGKLGNTYLKHRIYLDDKKYFRRHNAQIPPRSLFHTFLMNDSNKIILVGSPLRNEAIEKLFMKVIGKAINSQKQ